MKKHQSGSHLPGYSETVKPGQWWRIIPALQHVIQATIFHVLINQATMFRACSKHHQQVRVPNFTKDLKLKQDELLLLDCEVVYVRMMMSRT
jgi:hypothetical protein